MTEWFNTSLDHVLAELERLALRLHVEARRMRQGDAGGTDDRFRGLYVSEKQVDEILAASATATDIVRRNNDQACDADSLAAISPVERSIREKKKESRRRGVALRLDTLAEFFGLSPFEIDSLLLCMLPGTELKYGTLFGYIQDDMTKKRPAVETAIRLLCPPSGNTLELRQSFHPSAPLLRHGLVRFADDRLSSDTPLMGRQLEIDERIADYLLGLDSIDHRLLPFVRTVDANVDLEDAGITDDTRVHLEQLVCQLGDEPVVLYLQGAGGTGRKTVAAGLSRRLGKPLLVAELERIGEETPADSLLPLVFREALLQGAIPYFEGTDRLLAGGKGAGVAGQRLEDGVGTHAGWVILSGEQEWKPRQLWEDRFYFSVEFPVPTYSNRRQLWRTNAKSFSFDDDVDLDDLSARFRLNAGQIRGALLTARNAAVWRSPDHAVISREDIYAACRRLSRPGLSELAHKVVSSYGWQDIVLPREQLDQLREICSHVRYHQTVYGEWGFGRKLARGKGLNALFAGVSGTGKTMAAEIMAGELGYDLYKIDLSAIVSKYIGETEKNLDRIFKEAQLSNAILFFDEADAIFGKRSEVRDSHDRYANVETAYLLQKMEDYDGVVILATNLRKNMDDAFARRMHFTVEFPMPEEGDRQRIWEGIFPAEAPVAADVDFSFMARQFKISGGNIRNIAVAAAFLAAADDGSINMEALVKATKREYQKIGKLSTEGDFAQYFEVVKR